MLHPELDTLKKILSLERQREYADTVVVGGLDRFLARWLDGPSASPSIKLPSPDYASITSVQRKRWVEDTLKLLDYGPDTPVKSTPTPKRKAARSVPSLQREPEPDTSHSLSSPITVLPRVTPAQASKFKRLGVNTIRDLLYLFPRRHNDFGKPCKVSDLELDTEQTIVVNVWEAREVLMGIGGRRKATEAVVGDDTGNIRVVWFNQPYLARQFKPGTQLVLSGKVSIFRNTRVMESPEYEKVQDGEDLIHTGRLVPMYPLTDGLTPRTVRSLVKKTLDTWTSHIHDPLTETIRQRAGLLDLPQAVYQAHYPQDEESQALARRRLAFDELFMIQLYVFSRRRDWREARGAHPLPRNQVMLDAFSSRLPFTLTRAQEKALGEILGDMESERPMSRLLQGDVGSGKTAVALAALLSAVANGYQGAFMAPTEILAQQHFNNIYTLLEGLSRTTSNENWFTFHLDPFPLPFSVGLLIGSQGRKQKREIQEMMSQGTLDMVVGTHALLQQDVDLPRLALAVVDEQHRFGVMQRASLRQKGETPHLLVMSATPIPRSLALTLYGDLDLSVLDELPPGRQVIQTRMVRPERRNGAYEFLHREIKKGRQAFVVCPLIEESEVLQTRAATTEFNRLSTEVFPDLSLGLLHGRMPFKDKEEVMARFQRNELDILVSTPVIEVGIDNPNATVILIEGADRFGLAQLHQFRGRVGRGQHPSYCFLLSDFPSAEAKERLEVLERVSDGFAVAEEDLRFRGPGDYFGTRQSGLPDLRMARLSDQDILALARQEASALLKEDPNLEQPQHHALAQNLAQFSFSPQGEIN
ncbi:MAG: ATP-dependent DNA helicase RecG [Chloroflexi bacterium]|nr:ATP-dependent DNA helicase RecG [Chloroflexota bacterium]